MGDLNSKCLWPSCTCRTEDGDPCKFEDPDFYIERERERSPSPVKGEPTKPTVTTLCGSSRFPEAFALVNMHLTLTGRVVISLGCFGHADEPTGARHLSSDGDENTQEKRSLDQLHLRKIDLSDGIFVINVGGYVGSSTRREIDYALSKGKTVEYLFQTTGG